MDALCDLNIHGSGQTRIVLTLSKLKEGISQDKLAGILAVDKTTVSRMIRPLIANRIVKRTVNPADRRAYIVKLTEQTRTDIPEIRKRTRKWTEILKRDLPESDLECFFRCMDIMKGNAEAFLYGEDGGEK
jgi:DNA-binding MarR family transcriptional regulator